jgi:hypothetical protein
MAKDLMDLMREHCDECGWTGPWHTRDDAGELSCHLDLFGHLRAGHPDLYLRFSPEERSLFESGELEELFREFLADGVASVILDDVGRVVPTHEVDEL